MIRVRDGDENCPVLRLRLRLPRDAAAILSIRRDGLRDARSYFDFLWISWSYLIVHYCTCLPYIKMVEGRRGDRGEAKSQMQSLADLDPPDTSAGHLVQ